MIKCNNLAAISCSFDPLQPPHLAHHFRMLLASHYTHKWANVGKPLKTCHLVIHPKAYEQQGGAVSSTAASQLQVQSWDQMYSICVLRITLTSQKHDGGGEHAGGDKWMNE